MVTSEAAIQQQIRLDIATTTVELWRNQVGACEDKTGRVIRYGLMNDSKNLNSQFKSSDLVGIRPLLITPEWVGSVVGVFSALEVKASDWKYRATDDHSAAQMRFIELVQRAGGFAGFARSPAEARQILRIPT